MPKMYSLAFCRWMWIFFFFFSCLALVSIFCCGGKKTEHISELLFVSPLSERERRLMNGKYIFSPSSLTACRHLAASVPLASACGRSNSPAIHPQTFYLWSDGGTSAKSTCPALLLRPRNKQTNLLGREGGAQHFIVFYFFLFFFLRESSGTRSWVHARLGMWGTAAG